MRILTAGLCLAASSALMACGSYNPSAISVPRAIAVPAGASSFLEARASGFQIYKCSSRSDATYAWQLVAPDAVLRDRFGALIGKHYAGPTWESTDGSSVQGQVVASDPGPESTSVAWLLLSAKPKSGNGSLTATKFVQRLNTVGGVAPANGCDAASAGTETRIAYSATYVFYR